MDVVPDFSDCDKNKLAAWHWTWSASLSHILNSLNPRRHQNEISSKIGASLERQNWTSVRPGVNKFTTRARLDSRSNDLEIPFCDIPRRQKNSSQYIPSRKNLNFYQLRSRFHERFNSKLDFNCGKLNYLHIVHHSSIKSKLISKFRNKTFNWS